MTKYKEKEGNSKKGEDWREREESEFKRIIDQLMKNSFVF